MCYCYCSTNMYLTLRSFKNHGNIANNNIIRSHIYCEEYDIYFTLNPMLPSSPVGKKSKKQDVVLRTSPAQLMIRGSNVDISIDPSYPYMQIAVSSLTMCIH